jgi:hypothetical protein
MVATTPPMQPLTPPISAPSSTAFPKLSQPNSLASSDAAELGQLLQFLDDWLSTDHGPVDESLTRFVGCEAYGVESLRDDLARFTFLLGESDGEGLFSPRTPD